MRKRKRGVKLPDNNGEVGVIKSICSALFGGKSPFYGAIKRTPSVMAEAESLVNGPRGEDYDCPERNYDRIAKIASVLTGKSLTAIDCVDVMLATKLAREAHKHKRDNLVDLCGYAEIRNRLAEGRE